MKTIFLVVLLCTMNLLSQTYLDLTQTDTELQNILNGQFGSHRLSSVVSSGDAGDYNFSLSGTSTLIQTGNNTGVDELADVKYEAVKFTASTTEDIGSVAIQIKRTGTITNPASGIRCKIFTDNAGVPGHSFTPITTMTRYGNLTTSYAEYSFLVGSPVLTAGTVYWLVIFYDNVSTGGTVYYNSDATGTNTYASSTDSTNWTPANKSIWFKTYATGSPSIYSYSQNGASYDAYSLNYHGLKCHSVNDYGALIWSDNSYGASIQSIYSTATYSLSTYGIGVYGLSSSNIGVQGTSATSNGVLGQSTSGIGGYFISSSGHGVQGVSTDNNGVYGQSTSSIGTFGSSTSSYGGYFSSSSGVGVRGLSTSNIAGYFNSTSGLGLYITQNPTSTNTVVTSIDIQRNTSGTAANGIGVGILFHVEAHGADQSAAQITSTITDTTTGSEKGDLSLWTKTSGGALVNNFTIDSDGTAKTKNVFPKTDDTYYLGKNDDDTPFAYKGLILKDTTNGKYYRIEIINGIIMATDLTD